MDYLCDTARARLYVCVCVCVCVCVRASVCKCLCMRECVCARLSMRPCVYAPVSADGVVHKQKMHVPTCHTHKKKVLKSPDEVADSCVGGSSTICYG